MKHKAPKIPASSDVQKKEPEVEGGHSIPPPIFQLATAAAADDENNGGGDDPVQRQEGGSSGGEMPGSGAESPNGGEGGGLPNELQSQMEGAMGADFSGVGIHENSGKAKDIGALAYTQGNDIHFAPGQFNPESQSGQELIGHELAHVVQQREGRVKPTTQTSDGMPVNDDPGLESEADQMGAKAVQMKSSGNPESFAKSMGSLNLVTVQAKVIQKADPETDLEKLTRLLDQFNVPEGEVITLIGGLSATDKATVAGSSTYKSSITSAMDEGEMVRVVNGLNPSFQVKLNWIRSYNPGYSIIKAWITSASQADRDGLKAAWKDFFIGVCTNSTIIECLNDLNFDLVTKLTWVKVEMIPDYGQIGSWVRSASQVERDTLKTASWKSFFIDVCTNSTIIGCLNDLNFDLVTKLTWVKVEMNPDYSQIKSWITGASQAERDALKTNDWKAYFISVCVNSSIIECLNDLNFDLETKLKWAMGEMTPDYSNIKSWITGASQPERDALKTDDWKTYFISVCTNSTIIGCLNDLKFDLETKLKWVKVEMNPDYSQIKSWITKASQAERDALKTDVWKAYFISVCVNTSIIECLNDLKFDLETKLKWAMGEMTPNYSDIKTWITKASQPERDALKTNYWKTYFVSVCTNDTIVECLTDLKFDLKTKIDWIVVEMTPNYIQIQTWVTTASQADRDVLKTNVYKAHFVNICTDATMETALTDMKFNLTTSLDWLIAEGNGYEYFKRIINAASGAQQAVSLADSALLLRIKSHLSWNNFARSVELLGRSCPSGAAMIANGNVQGALAAAWAASNPAIVPGGGPVPAGVHEEGGFIYLNIVDGTMSTSRVAPGAQASLPIENPSPPENSITVGGFHTHPNVGVAWGPPQPSGADTAWANRKGFPLLFRGAFPLVANVGDGSTGPTRLHLAGSRKEPGAAGGLAPQKPLDGALDEPIEDKV